MVLSQVGVWQWNNWFEYCTDSSDLCDRQKKFVGKNILTRISSTQDSSSQLDLPRDEIRRLKSDSVVAEHAQRETTTKLPRTQLKASGWRDWNHEQACCPLLRATRVDDFSSGGAPSEPTDVHGSSFVVGYDESGGGFDRGPPAWDVERIVHGLINPMATPNHH